MIENEEDKTISVINVSSLTVTETIDLGFTPGMASFHSLANELWVSDPDKGEVHFFTRENGTWKDQGTIVTDNGAHAIGFSSDGQKAFVTNQFAGNVSEIDVKNRTKIADVKVGEKPNGLTLKN